jgi:hypothetical protein
MPIAFAMDPDVVYVSLRSGNDIPSDVIEVYSSKSNNFHSLRSNNFHSSRSNNFHSSRSNSFRSDIVCVSSSIMSLPKSGSRFAKKKATEPS